MYTRVYTLTFVLYMDRIYKFNAKRLLFVVVLLLISSASGVRAHEGVVGPGDRSTRSRGDVLRGTTRQDELFGYEVMIGYMEGLGETRSTVE